MAKSGSRRGGSAADRLVLVGRDRPRLQKRSPRGWTKVKERQFLSSLADTCNVSRACAEANVSSSAVYRRRRLDAAFRAGWMEALAAAYQRLELVLLDRAFNGTEKLVKRRDGSEERMTEYPDQLGLTLLKMHRATAVEAANELPPEEVDEIRERLLDKLRRLKARRDAEASARS